MTKSGNRELTPNRKKRWVKNITKKRKKQAALDRKNKRAREINLELSLKRQRKALGYTGYVFTTRDKLDYLTMRIRGPRISRDNKEG